MSDDADIEVMTKQTDISILAKEVTKCTKICNLIKNDHHKEVISEDKLLSEHDVDCLSIFTFNEKIGALCL